MTEPLSVTPNRIEFPALTIDLFDGSAPEADDDAIWMFKSHWYVTAYREIKAVLEKTGRQMNILEVGIFKGGSTVFLDQFFEPTRLACLDLHDQLTGAARRYFADRADRISVRTDVDQSDRVTLHEIMDRFDGDLDLVIDDASHLYEPSKATFEAAFPRLRQGGVYILEDWGWSFSAGAQQPDHYWANQNALVNLVFEFVLLMGIRDAAGRAIIEDIRFGPGMVWLIRGPGQISRTGFAIDEHKMLRGRAMPLL